MGAQLANEVPIHKYEDELWDLQIAINLTSHYRYTKHVIPEFLKNGKGNIVNIASIQGLQSMRGVCAYAACKGGILSLYMKKVVGLKEGHANLR